MAFTTKLWEIRGKEIHEAEESNLSLESRLEDWIEKDPSILGIEIAIIGRQVATEYGGYIDLLGIDRDGDLVILELKRNRTPRDVVAQTLDYASWVNKLEYNAIEELATRYISKSLESLFQTKFDAGLPENINVNHRLIIVASELDDSTERIVQYLYQTHKVNINAIFFSIFKVGDKELLARSWINDPEEVEEESRKTKKSPWSGYLFVNTGITDENDRDWELNRKYNYVGAGGGQRWIRSIKKLRPDDKIFAYIKGKGYVGYGIVEEEAVPITQFLVNGTPITHLLPRESKLGGDRNNIEKTEWLARVKWVKTVPEAAAKKFTGVFANQNVVCKLRDKPTFDFLTREFEI